MLMFSLKRFHYSVQLNIERSVNHKFSILKTTFKNRIHWNVENMSADTVLEHNTMMILNLSMNYLRKKNWINVDILLLKSVW